ncbi:hypothetical protein [uncultured Aquimarina sp.]|uniref:hypothetical protein n=1 Tax=uncultured Aquimarina sp. TaxID=575652 RepID=UPI002610977C|nr:hypothetical protein [uncultured Aquimarina sp.]
MVATVDLNPIKEWKFIGQNNSIPKSINIKDNLSSAGWYMSRELGIYPKLESYFGIYPWYLVVGKTALNNLIFSGKPSKYA